MSFPLPGLYVSTSCPLQLQKNESQPHPLFLRHQERTHAGWWGLLVLIHAHLSPSLRTTWKRYPHWSIFTDPQWNIILFTCPISREGQYFLSITLCPVPSDDDSITSNCFFMLGKMGKPNQTLWVMPFHVVGICTQWYSPNKFEDIDSAMKLTVEDKTILSKAMILLDL